MGKVVESMIIAGRHKGSRRPDLFWHGVPKVMIEKDYKWRSHWARRVYMRSTPFNPQAKRDYFLQRCRKYVSYFPKPKG